MTFENDRKKRVKQSGIDLTKVKAEQASKKYGNFMDSAPAFPPGHVIISWGPSKKAGTFTKAPASVYV